MNPAVVPQFYLVRGQNDMAPDAFQYVQHLSLQFNIHAIQHGGWLAELLPKMTSLREVTLNLDDPHTKRDIHRWNNTQMQDFANVVGQLRNLSEKPMVHLFLRMFFSAEHQQTKYFENLAEKWPQWTDLDIQTLEIEVGGSQFIFSDLFCKQLGKLKSLKRFALRSPNLSRCQFGDGDLFESSEFAATKVCEWLKGLEQLEDLSMSLYCSKTPDDEANESENEPKDAGMKWYIPPNVHRLEMPICRLDVTASFEKFDSVTLRLSLLASLPLNSPRSATCKRLSLTSTPRTT